MFRRGSYYHLVVSNIITTCGLSLLGASYHLTPWWDRRGKRLASQACSSDGTEVYVAQRGGTTPIVVLDYKTGTFRRAFGKDTATNQSMIAHIHGLSWSARNPAGANLWARRLWFRCDV